MRSIVPTLFFMALMIFSNFANANTFSIEAEFKTSGDLIEVDDNLAKKEGWTIEEEDEEKTYKLSIKVDRAQLPLQKVLGDSYLRVSKKGLIELGISVGDADAGASSSLQWPSEDDELIPLKQPLILAADGGEYASGSWSFEAKASVKYE